MVGEIVYAKSLASSQSTVMFQHGAEVVSPMSAAKPVEFIEPAGSRVIRVLHPIVPFAKRRSGIAGSLELLSDGRLVQVHALAASRRGIDVGSWMVTSREKFGPSRGTHRANKEIAEHGSIANQSIDVRRLHIQVALKTKVTVSLIIGKEHHHVGAGCCAG